MLQSVPPSVDATKRDRIAAYDTKNKTAIEKLYFTSTKDLRKDTVSKAYQAASLCVIEKILPYK